MVLLVELKCVLIKMHAIAVFRHELRENSALRQGEVQQAGDAKYELPCIDYVFLFTTHQQQCQLLSPKAHESLCFFKVTSLSVSSTHLFFFFSLLQSKSRQLVACGESSGEFPAVLSHRLILKFSGVFIWGLGWETGEIPLWARLWEDGKMTEPLTRTFAFSHTENVWRMSGVQCMSESSFGWGGLISLVES